MRSKQQIAVETIQQELRILELRRLVAELLGDDWDKKEAR